MKKRLSIAAILGVGLALATTFSSFAGEWKQDTKGWWYQNDDGSYVANNWLDVDGKRYHFDENGYMLTGWNKLPATRFNVNGDGSKSYYDTEAWYYFEPSGELLTQGNWDGGAIGPDGSLYVDNHFFENGEIFYQRSWNYDLPDAIGPHKEYHRYRGFVDCALPWKKELASLLDTTMSSSVGTYKLDYQLPDTWMSECPKPLMSEMIRTVAVDHVLYVNEGQSRSWSVDDNNVIHIEIKGSLSH